MRSRPPSAGSAASKAINATSGEHRATRWTRKGYRALTGITVGLSNLVTGEFGAGYVQQRFDDPSIGTIDGPSYRARLTWRPTRLLDVHFNAEQIVTQTSDTSATGVLANAVQLGLDYELRRNVIVSLAGGYENDKFFGQLRKDNVITVRHARQISRQSLRRRFRLLPLHQARQRPSRLQLRQTPGRHECYSAILTCPM